MESPTQQIDFNPSKDELELQHIPERQINDTDNNAENSKPENPNTKVHDPPLEKMKKNYEDIPKDPHFKESGICPPFIKSVNLSSPRSSVINRI